MYKFICCQFVIYKRRYKGFSYQWILKGSLKFVNQEGLLSHICPFPVEPFGCQQRANSESTPVLCGMNDLDRINLRVIFNPVGTRYIFGTERFVCPVLPGFPAFPWPISLSVCCFGWYHWPAWWLYRWEHPVLWMWWVFFDWYFVIHPLRHHCGKEPVQFKEQVNADAEIGRIEKGLPRDLSNLFWPVLHLHTSRSCRPPPEHWHRNNDKCCRVQYRVVKNSMATSPLPAGHHLFPVFKGID